MSLWTATPLLGVASSILPAGADVYTKFEAANPTGSVKDRTARWMVDAAEASGTLRAGGARRTSA